MLNLYDLFLAVDKPIRLACVLVQCSPKPMVYIVFNQPVKVSVCVCACDGWDRWVGESMCVCVCVCVCVIVVIGG